MEEAKKKTTMQKRNTEDIPAPVHAYKDRIFRMIFKEKKEFLELYNAMNGTDYSNPEDLAVTTLENAIYMNMKNDVSFLLHDRLTLYEHQSTDNPNMPLRNLFYVSEIYSGLTHEKNLYHSRTVLIPEPRFVEFYNGTKKLPERSERRLSDLYQRPTGHPALELKILVLNINPGCNTELMEQCHALKEYMLFVKKIREYRKQMPLVQAMEQTVTECISEGILAGFLKKNRAEVIKVGIYEYNEELHIQQERSDAKEEGREEGIWLFSLRLIRKKKEKVLSPEQTADILEMNPETVQNFYTLLEENPGMDESELYEKHMDL